MKTAPDPPQNPRFADLLAPLRAQPPPSPSPDFTRQTLTRARQAEIRHAPWTLRAARLAASISILLGLGLWFTQRPPALNTQPTAIAIVMASQRPDGSWPAAAPASHSRYDTSVTALALLALMKMDGPLPGDYTAAIHDGINHLVRQQDAQGRFTSQFSGVNFTQYLATMAIRAAAARPDAEASWIEASRRADAIPDNSRQMAKLNQNLAHPAAFPPNWLEAGGPVTRAALDLLVR